MTDEPGMRNVHERLVDPEAPEQQLNRHCNELFYGQPDVPEDDTHGKPTMWRAVLVVGVGDIVHPTTKQRLPWPFAAFNAVADRPEYALAMARRLREIAGDIERIVAEQTPTEPDLVDIIHVGLEPQPGEDWIFTFGPAHRHPETGEPLRDKYVRIRQPWKEARRTMFAMFRDRWSHMSRGSDAQMFELEYGTTELPESEWPTPKGDDRGEPKETEEKGE